MKTARPAPRAPRGLFNRHSVDPWQDDAVIRANLFGTERLEHHAVSLAQAQPVGGRVPRVRPLSARVRANSVVLVSACQSCSATVKTGHAVTLATEWLLDNFHLVDRKLQ